MISGPGFYIRNKDIKGNKVCSLGKWSLSFVGRFVWLVFTVVIFLKCELCQVPGEDWWSGRSPVPVRTSFTQTYFLCLEYLVRTDGWPSVLVSLCISRCHSSDLWMTVEMGSEHWSVHIRAICFVFCFFPLFLCVCVILRIELRILGKHLITDYTHCPLLSLQGH